MPATTSTTSPRRTEPNRAEIFEQCRGSDRQPASRVDDRQGACQRQRPCRRRGQLGRRRLELLGDDQEHGDVALTGVTVVDPLTGQNIVGVALAVGETKVYTSSYAITQADLDGAGNAAPTTTSTTPPRSIPVSAGNAGADHDIDNTATAHSNQTTPTNSNTVEVPLFPPQVEPVAFDGEPRPTWSHDHNAISSGRTSLVAEATH